VVAAVVAAVVVEPAIGARSRPGFVHSALEISIVHTGAVDS
jgi:hypothetical protein